MESTSPNFKFEVGQWVTLIGKPNPGDPFAFWITARMKNAGGKLFYRPEKPNKWFPEERLVASGDMLVGATNVATTGPRPV